MTQTLEIVKTRSTTRPPQNTFLNIYLKKYTKEYMKSVQNSLELICHFLMFPGKWSATRGRCKHAREREHVALTEDGFNPGEQATCDWLQCA